jgi:hypothetical protein
MAETKYLSDLFLRELLVKASNDERLALTRILKESTASAIDGEKLQIEICEFAGNSIFNLLRGHGIPYSEILFDAATSLKIETAMSRNANIHGGISIASLDDIKRYISIETDDLRLNCINYYIDQLERQILAKLTIIAYGQATPEQRANVDARVAELTKTPQGKDLTGLSTAAALLAIGNAGGFATYTIMSSALSAISFGSLPFVSYTFASSLLSLALGPAGWLTIAVYGAVKFAQPNELKVVQLAVTCALISQRLREAKLERN